jgi:tetratricopeptide (TPR) repeat protein
MCFSKGNEMSRFLFVLLLSVQIFLSGCLSCSAFVPTNEHNWAAIYEAAGNALDKNDLSSAELMIRSGMTATGGNTYRSILMFEMLAELYEKQEKFAQEEGVLRAMVAQMERVSLPPNVLAAAYLKVGEVNYILNDYCASAEYAMRALPVLVLCYGPDSPHVAVALNNLASAECSQNKLIESFRHFRQALDIARASVGQRSELYGMTALNLGYVCKELGNSKESSMWYKRASRALVYSKGAQNPAALEAARQCSMSSKKVH